MCGLAGLGLWAVGLGGCDQAEIKPPQHPTEAPAPTSGAGGDPAIEGPDVTLVDPVAQGMSVEGVTALCDDHLAKAQKILAAIKSQDPQKPTTRSCRSSTRPSFPI
jgi:hypothetical protein